MLKRREFLTRLGYGLAGVWALGKVAWPLDLLGQEPEVRIALLADAHLKNGDDHRPEALALARAVAEMRALKPTPHLVLFAGDPALAQKAVHIKSKLILISLQT